MSDSFINKLMLEGIQEYSKQPSSHLSEIDVERLWHGFNNEPVWMKNYFQGFRYTTKKKHFPTSEIASNGGLIIPPADVKDICGTETRTVGRGEDSKEFVFLTYRKMVTQELVIPFVDAPFQGTQCMAVEHMGGMRYFLDTENGEFPMTVALHRTINTVGNELIMGRQLFSWFLYHCQKLNAEGSFATFEWARLDGEWYSIKRLFMLGPEKKKAKVESHYSNALAPKGRRYAAEYRDATMVQTNMAMECATQPVFTMSERTRTVVAIDDGRSDRTESAPDVICARRSLTITDEGRVTNTQEKVNVIIERPLQNWGVNLVDKPSSKSQCPELSVAPAAKEGTGPTSEDTTPIVKVLSLLGAKGGADSPAALAGKVAQTGYVRVDKAWKTIFPALTGRGPNLMSLNLQESGVKHKAGNRGTFPVYRATPVIKIGDAWYNARTLEMEEYGKLTIPSTVRYLELAPSFYKK
ncbi:unnamed protein product [Scytosiphon promiscuus]